MCSEKKTSQPASALTLGEANRMVAKLGGWLGRKGDGEPGAESLAAGLRRLQDMLIGWRLHASPPGSSQNRTNSGDQS